MRIRSAAIVYIGVVGLVATAGVAAVWSDTRARLNAVEGAQKVVDAVAPAIEFAEVFARERGTYAEILTTGGPEALAGDPSLAARTAATDRVFRRVAGLSDGLPSPVSDVFAREIVAASAAVREARRTALRSELSPDLTALAVVAGFRNAGLSAARAIDAAESALPAELKLSPVLEIANLSNRLREQAGARSMLLSRYVITGRTFDSPARMSANRLGGAIDVTVDMIDRIAARTESAEVRAAVSRLHATFVDLGQPMFERMYEAGRDGRPPPLAGDDWREWTAATLATTLSARDAPIRHVQNELRGMRADATRRFVLAVAALSVVVAFVLVGGFLVETRVVGPVARLTDALARMGDGEGSPEFDAMADRYGPRTDEIGSLARALRRFRDKSAETAALYRRIDAILDNLPQGVCVYDSTGTLTASNRRYAELYGLDPRTVRPGVTLKEVVDMRIETGAVKDTDGYAAALMAITSGMAIPQRRIVELADGRFVAVHANPMPGGGWLSTHMDVTSRARAEQRVNWLASHDLLTDLPNRAALYVEIEKRLERRAGDASIAVMCIDLDRFKAVNDSLGHALGDELLKQVALRLSDGVGPAGMVARLGGDEFAAIVEASDDAGASVVAQRIIDGVSAPYRLDGHNAVIGATVGIASAPRDGAAGPTLLKAADLAMYRAKAEGRGRYRFFEPEMDAKMRERRQLEIDLRAALAGGEFELHYQPIQDLGSGRIVAFEALIRWNHPLRGRVSPNDFIPLAEETGLIVDIGAWVLRQACVEAAAWPRPVRVAVNLSPHQFRGGKLLLDASAALKDSGLPAARLQLEITERVMLDSDETTLQTLHALRNLGTRVSMDDFGIGYSSLSYLQSFPFDKIKIDRCFVENLAESDGDRAIVKAVTGLAGDMGMTTTAEGVETTEQVELLRRAGCTEIQGYLVSRPVPAADAAAMLEAEPARGAA